MDAYSSYATLVRPEWAPPAWLFAPVWTYLYILIAVSFGYVFWQTFKKRWPRAVALPFALNLVFNFSFTYLQFGLQNYWLAALDVILVLATLIWAIAVIWRRQMWVALANIPYLLWVSFATILQLTVTYLNW